VLSYRELAARLGVSAEGARTRAKRSGWPIIHGNDGRARVRVRASELPERPREQQPRPAEQTPVTVERSPELRDLLDRMSREAEQARATAEQAVAEVTRLRTQLALAEERVRSAQAVAIADVEAARRVAESEAAAKDVLIEELRAMLAEARRSWWSRLLGK
jgi:hypothetical protein